MGRHKIAPDGWQNEPVQAGQLVQQNDGCDGRAEPRGKAAGHAEKHVGKFVKFKILNPSENQNLRSLTLDHKISIFDQN